MAGLAFPRNLVSISRRYIFHSFHFALHAGRLLLVKCPYKSEMKRMKKKRNQQRRIVYYMYNVYIIKRGMSMRMKAKPNKTKQNKSKQKY